MESGLMNIGALLRSLHLLGCHPGIYRRGRLWRAHVNIGGKFWHDAQTPEAALLGACERWEDAGRPVDGAASRRARAADPEWDAS